MIEGTVFLIVCNDNYPTISATLQLIGMLSKTKNSIPLSKDGICGKTSEIQDSDTILLQPELLLLQKLLQQFQR